MGPLIKAPSLFPLMGMEMADVPPAIADRPILTWQPYFAKFILSHNGYRGQMSENRSS
jgi:hypothetical protein